jgi:hypothetical protein
MISLSVTINTKTHRFLTSIAACRKLLQVRPIATTRDKRFLGKGHEQPVSPLKRVLMRVVPELQAELAPVVNAFDPWARDRGEYYSLEWKPRPGAESDEAFKRYRFIGFPIIPISPLDASPQTD